MGIKDENMKNDIARLVEFESTIVSHPLKKRPDYKEIQNAYEKKQELEIQVRLSREEVKKAREGQFTEELKARERVLRRMQYMDGEGTITAKGRIACEIQAADEILLTEMLLSGVFRTLQPPDAAALLSCFIFEEKTDKTPPLDAELTSAYQTLLVRNFILLI